VNGSTLASRPDAMICPFCEAGELLLFGGVSTRCDSCARTVEGAVAKILGQIASLPDALGGHACEECSHPEMRRLPDGVFHCPACGSEVLPPEVGSIHIVARTRKKEVRR
jgi:ribosomal protein L37AE/L43A